MPTAPKTAESDFREATSVIIGFPGHSESWKGLARALDAQGKTLQAFAAYQKAFELPKGRMEYSTFPDDIEALARYGTLCEAFGQHEAAARAYQKAQEQLYTWSSVPLEIQADSQYAASQQLPAMLEVVRGLALIREDKTEKALTALQQAASLQPKDARVQYYLGYGYRKAGQFAQAQAAFQKAARLDKEGTVRAATEEDIRAVQAHRR